MCVEVIVCYISVVFLRHSVHTLFWDYVYISLDATAINQATNLFIIALQNVAEPPAMKQTARESESQLCGTSQILDHFCKSKSVNIVCKLFQRLFVPKTPLLGLCPWTPLGTSVPKLPGPKPQMKIFGGVTAINVE